MVVDKSKIICALRDYYIQHKDKKAVQRQCFFRGITAFNGQHAQAWNRGWDEGYSTAYDELEDSLAKILEATEEENGGGMNRSGCPVPIEDIAKRRMLRLKTLEEENAVLRSQRDNERC